MTEETAGQKLKKLMERQWRECGPQNYHGKAHWLPPKELRKEVFDRSRSYGGYRLVEEGEDE
jgi:hypothetical protein